MNFFTQLLNSTTPLSSPLLVHDLLGDLHESWNYVYDTLVKPDEGQIARGIRSTRVSYHLEVIVDCLVKESSKAEEGTTGSCLEYLLKNDVLGTLVTISEPDRPVGAQAEVLRAISNMIVHLNEQFLVHTAVHRPVLRLLRTCVGDELEDHMDGQKRVMGAAGNVTRTQPSQYEEDLVDLLCTLCSRIRSYPELLMIFFYDKHWFHLHNATTNEVVDMQDDDEDTVEGYAPPIDHPPSPSSSQNTITAAVPVNFPAKQDKPEYEFLLFNYLLRFVHREGRIGDYARAGMLFLMDVAMSARENTNHDADNVVPQSQPSDPVTEAGSALADYILEGDFPEVLGAGLSAVYSLMPTKLRIVPGSASNSEAPPSVALGYSESSLQSLEDETPGIGTELSSSPDFRVRLDHFLNMIEFVQDILQRHVNAETGSDSGSTTAHIGAFIVASVLAAIRRIFLENVFYPSILECSDHDGSSVAVMSYLDAILRTSERGPFVEMLLRYLLNEDDEGDSQQSHRRLLDVVTPRREAAIDASKEAKIRRRKSSAMMLLEIEAPEAQRESDYAQSYGRYTLKDLIVANINSVNKQSGTAAYQLLQTLLLLHCQDSIHQLLSVIPYSLATGYAVRTQFSEQLFGENRTSTPDSEKEQDHFVYRDVVQEPQPTLPPDLNGTTLATHNRELGLYLGLGPSVGAEHANEDGLSTSYSHYLQDAVQDLICHPCYRDSTATPLATISLHGHRFNPNDELIRQILRSLCEFFSHPPEYNIALTGALAKLALCPYRSLAGWITLDTETSSPSLSRLPSEDDLYAPRGQVSNVDEDGIIDRIAAGELHLPAASITEFSRPVVYSVLRDLFSHLEKCRETIDDFDVLLRKRRDGLLFSENLLDAMVPTSDGSSPFTTPIKGHQPGSPQARASEPVVRRRDKARATLISFLTPTKRQATSKQSSTPRQTSPPRHSQEAVAPRPFGEHYKLTMKIKIEPFVGRLPSRGPWATPAEQSWSIEEEDVFSADRQWKAGHKEQWSVDSSMSRKTGHRGREEAPLDMITLSQLLDNVVILEECVKELAGIIEARRCLGIDAIRYI